MINILFNKRHKYKIPVTQQLTQYECGLCCLKMILNYYNYNISMNDLRKYFESSMNGISLFHLKSVACKFNLTTNVKKINSSTLYNIKNIQPSILLWNNNHYVILEKKQKNNFIIIDPDIGRTKISYTDFEKSFSGYIMLLEPNENFKKLKNTYKTFRYFISIFKYKKILFSILFFSLFLQLISLCIPMLTTNIINNIFTNSNDFLTNIMLAIFVLIFLQFLLGYIKNKLLILFQSKIDYCLLDKFVNHLMKLPYKFFQIRNCGDLIQRLNSNTIARDIIIKKIIPAFMNIILITAIFIYMFITSQFLTYIVLLLALIQLTIVLITKSKMKLLTQSQVLAQTEINTFLTEIIKGISTIKTLEIENHILKEWDNILKNQIYKESDKYQFQSNIDLITNLIISFSPLLIIVAGISQVVNGNLNIGELFAFQSLTLSFLTPISFISTIINDITLLSVLLERIDDVLNEEKITDKYFLSSKKQNSIIEIHNLSFKHSETAPYILKNISLNINEGEKIAIVGESGCGKSTLGLLICGLYKPTKGYISINNSSIINKGFENTFGIVMQDNILFNKTIWQNICIKNDDIDFNTVKETCKLAAIHDDINSLPMGYDTVLSESATNLSGGQKQRISIARALFKKPQILLLDEATSALDSLTESKIINNISSLKCTQIIIAHRLSTIKNADKIILLDKGEIINIGDHNKLMSESYYYRNLYKNSTVS